MTMNTTIRN